MSQNRRSVERGSSINKRNLLALKYLQLCLATAVVQSHLYKAATLGTFKSGRLIEVGRLIIRHTVLSIVSYCYVCIAPGVKCLHVYVACFSGDLLFLLLSVIPFYNLSPIR